MRCFLKWFLVILIVRGSRSVIWPCTTSEDCSKVPEARCSVYGFCQCPAGHVFSTDVKRCLPERSYGVACEEGVQCSHMLTGAKCDNVCTCDTGYTYVRGRCRQLVNLHESCVEDIDCFFSYNREAVECRDGTCQCAPGFYERSTNVCRREVSLGDMCLVNQDCVGDNLECRNHECQEIGSAAQTKTFRDIGVQAPTRTEEKAAQAEEVELPPPPKTRDQQQQTSGSINSEPSSRDNKEDEGDQRRKKDASSSSGATAKRVRLYSSIDSPTTKDDSTPGFGDTCTEETQECVGVPYSVCRVGQCLCREGYFAVGRDCKPELGEYASRKEECPALTLYSGDKCVCANDQFYNYNMRACLKGVQGINTPCTASSQCSPYGAAYCNLQVIPKNCICYPYAEYDAKRQMCVPKKGYEEFCEKDTQCTLANAHCTTENTCVCKPNFFYVNERCKAGKEEVCKTVEDCAFEGAVCESEEDEDNDNNGGGGVEQKPKKCDCAKGHLYHQHDNTCLKEAEAYEEECSANEQCKPLLGDLGKCVDEKCKCDENDTHYKDGKCHAKKALNERCSTSSECFVENGADNVECRNRSCQCTFDNSPDVERQICVKPSSKSSSDRPSALKVITLMLTSAAILITGSALRDAYYA